MKRFQKHLLESWAFLLTLPLTAILWGLLTLYSIDTAPTCEGWKVSNTGNIHGQDSYWFPVVSGPCYNTYEEALGATK